MSMRFGFVSTYPPTQCGLATFAAALRGALLDGTGDEGRVVRLVDAPEPGAGEVVAQLVAGEAASLRQAAEHLNQCDIAIVQHEYGVYGGADGSEALQLLDQVTVPSVVILHTVLADPAFRTGPFTVLTWGLLGPGKGVEWGIAAMAMLRDLAPMPRYLIAGQTHPKVARHEGEA
jgi:hypothetical protein